MPRTTNAGGSATGVRVREPLDREAGLLEHAAELAGAIAADVLQHLVVLAPQELERGHADEDPPSRTDQPTDLRQQLLLVGEVLEHVEQHHDVEAPGRERQVSRAGAGDGREPRCAAVLQRERRAVDAEGTDALAEPREDPAGPAADVEHAQPGPRERVAEERGHEEPLPDEPPVAVLEAAHLVDLAGLHRTGLGTRGARWMQLRGRFVVGGRGW
jgi:hypothetical protein